MDGVSLFQLPESNLLALAMPTIASSLEHQEWFSKSHQLVFRPLQKLLGGGGPLFGIVFYLAPWTEHSY